MASRVNGKKYKSDVTPLLKVLQWLLIAFKTQSPCHILFNCVLFDILSNKTIGDYLHMFEISPKMQNELENMNMKPIKKET